MSTFSRLRRNQRGGVIIEFAFSALVIITVLLTTIEFGIEMFIRQSTERAASAAAMNYAESRSMEEANAAIRDAVPAMMLRCVQPVRVRLYNNIQGKDLTTDSVGFRAMDNGGDNSAKMARVSFTCAWDRITPISRTMFGPSFEDTVTVYTRMRD